MDGTGYPLEAYSNAMAGLVAGIAPSLVIVHGRRRMPSSGFAWKAGLIVTAEEAVTRDDDLAVTLADGRKLAATLVGRDPSTDIALLRIDKMALALPAPGTAQTLAAGSLVLAAGRGSDGPMAQSGIVSQSGPAWRSMRGGQIDQLVRLDFRVRPTIEGGLVLAANGAVLGMLAVAPRGAGLVIPLATVNRVANVLEQHGQVARGYLGLGLQPVRLDEAVATAQKLTNKRALMVVNVDEQGPGQPAGFLQGDIVVRWNGEEVADLRTVMRRLGPESVGQPAKLDILRAGSHLTISMAVAARPAT